MPGRIPKEFIDDLIDRADIVEVIGSRVQLKKAGREYKSPCPFHNEKTPSFTVSPGKGFYHCFGCGAHGTALGFLMDYERLEFPEAIEELAHMMGLTVPRDEQAERQAPTAPILDALNKAAQIYQRALKTHQPAIDYLKSRGLSGANSKAFGIGYAPGGWDFLLKQFPNNENTHDQLLGAGLIAKRDSGGYYDRFRERIIFPIRDSRGRVVAFGGRIIGDGEPKYLNSPETAVFHKGRELYGLYEARKSLRNIESLLVVEGYMDVVSLAGHGIHNAVATLGTATTADHLKRLFRAAREVTFCFDGDRAGRDAAWRALRTALPEMRDGRQISFLFLDEGEDPDTMVRQHGAKGLQDALLNKVTLSEYLFREVGEQNDISSIDGRAAFAEMARPLIDLAPEGVFRELLTDELARIVGLSRDKLTVLDTRQAPVQRRPQKAGRVASRSTLVRHAIEIIINNPETVANIAIPEALHEADLKGLPLLLELIDIINNKPGILPSGLLERFRNKPEFPHLEALLIADSTIIEVTQKEAQLSDCFQRIIASGRKQRFAELVSKAGSPEGLSQDEREEFKNLSMLQQNTD
ncbi:MAG: DNA primase [Gammaproteobacteria bacterium]|nr:DNA primase [Gammaproteobacteria bacterium]